MRLSLKLVCSFTFLSFAREKMGVETKSCYVTYAGLELIVDLRSAGTSGMCLCAALGLIVIPFTDSHIWPRVPV